MNAKQEKNRLKAGLERKANKDVRPAERNVHEIY